MEKTLDEPTKRVLAVRASVDPRTIDKVYRGAPVKGMAGYRAAAALRAVGLLPLREQPDVPPRLELVR